MMSDGTTDTNRSGGLGFAVVGAILLVVMPLLNLLPPEDSWFHLSDFSLNRFGKFLAFAILALGLDLIWGYTGILSLGQGVFFGLGAYCMGMHMMLTIGKESVYGSDLPDFMVWNKLKSCRSSGSRSIAFQLRSLEHS
jgi:urea transport system permease protein